MKGSSPFSPLSALFPPLLLAAYSVLVLYAQNINELELSEILPTLAAVLAGSLLGTLLLAYVFKDARKGGVAGAFLMLGLLFYGLFFSGLDSFLGGRAWHKVFLPFWLIFIAGAAWYSTRTKERLYTMATLVLAISLVLVAMPLMKIVQYQIFGQKDVAEMPRHEEIIMQRGGELKGGGPAIYYLIFDRYAANRTLKRDYGFDNSEFLRYLESRGFYVAYDSYANYPKTAHSLASSLNMRYLDVLSESLAGGSSDWKPLHRMIKDFELGRVLKQLGYVYVHLGSWWSATRKNDLADEIYSIDPGGEFTSLYLKNTLFVLNRNFFNKLPNLDAVGDIDQQKQCNRVLYKFRKLDELIERKEPLFVFAHMLIPHGPFVLDENGRCMSKKEAENRTRKENYVGQVKYVNSRLKKLVDQLLSAEEKPIIVLQSDEGPFPRAYREEKEAFNWKKATDDELQEKFRILNAYYLPGFDKEELYPGLTPVNSFRMILSHYFGLKYEHLPDRAFAFIDEHHLYDFFEVTEKVK